MPNPRGGVECNELFRASAPAFKTIHRRKTGGALQARAPRDALRPFSDQQPLEQSVSHPRRAITEACMVGHLTDTAMASPVRSFLSAHS